MAEWEMYKNGCYSKKCESLDDLIETIELCYSFDSKKLFRGHSNEKDYKLISTLDREYDKIDKFIEGGELTISRESFIEDALQLFRKRIRGKVNSDVYFTDNEKAWALGQHYGLNTPYLDWTELPYVAAFFCVVSKQDKDGCIYALDIVKINELNTNANNNENLKELLKDYKKTNFEIDIKEPMTNFNTRLNTQNGCFTVTPNGIAIDDWINCFEDSKEEEVLQKIIIPKELKSKIFDFLRKANINYSTIYPDLEGVCKYCNMEIISQAKTSLLQATVLQELLHAVETMANDTNEK